jgi:phosphinothricin acetyltransferase
MEPIIRKATRQDLARLNEIYNEYIVDSHTSFDTDPWTLSERLDWFAKYETDGAGCYRVLVSQVGGRVIGFASSSPFRHKAAYDTSVETTIVLEQAATGQRHGQPLMEALIGQLAASGVHRAYALIALPNEPSIKLHARVGYQPVGTLDEVGHKLDQFHSVHIMELRL